MKRFLVVIFILIVLFILGSSWMILKELGMM
jgi:hypothetical protein